MRRKPGRLLAIEAAICFCAADLLQTDEPEFYGYQIAKAVGQQSNRQLLTAYGTLYRALIRLEAMGLVQSRWEDPEIPARENRPGRRLYLLTASGQSVVADLRNAGSAPPIQVIRRPVTP